MNLGPPPKPVQTRLQEWLLAKSYERSRFLVIPLFFSFVTVYVFLFFYLAFFLKGVAKSEKYEMPQKGGVGPKFRPWSNGVGAKLHQNFMNLGPPP